MHPRFLLTNLTFKVHSASVTRLGGKLRVIRRNCLYLAASDSVSSFKGSATNLTYMLAEKEAKAPSLRWNPRIEKLTVIPAFGSEAGSIWVMLCRGTVRAF